MISLLSLVLGLVVAQRPQAEFGVDQSIHWAETPYHPLQAAVGPGRNIEISIKFQKPFTNEPKIILATTKIDCGKLSAQGYDISVTSKNTLGFTVRFTATTENPVFGFDLAWGAIYDPDISVVEFYKIHNSKTPEGATITIGKNGDIATIAYPDDFKPKEPPKAVVFLLGAQIKGDYHNILAETGVVTTKQVTVKVSANYRPDLYIIQFYHVMVLLGKPELLLIGTWSQLPFNNKDPSDPYQQYEVQRERIKTFSSSITDPNFQSGTRYSLYGFSGYGFLGKENLRLVGKNYYQSKQSIKADIGTWQNSFLIGFAANWFVYKPQLNKYIPSPDCADIFEECYYGGSSFRVCDRDLSFPKSGWNKPVKSFKVPAGKVLKVYQQENLEGKSIRIEQNLQCMEVPKFSYLELHSVQQEDKNEKIVSSNLRNAFWDE
ncbi:hypothetical protein pb186bvf_011386 [Paramecium bursaria]